MPFLARPLSIYLVVENCVAAVWEYFGGVRPALRGALFNL